MRHRAQFDFYFGGILSAVCFLCLLTLISAHLHCLQLASLVMLLVVDFLFRLLSFPIGIDLVWILLILSSLSGLSRFVAPVGLGLLHLCDCSLLIGTLVVRQQQ